MREVSHLGSNCLAFRKKTAHPATRSTVSSYRGSAGIELRQGSKGWEVKEGHSAAPLVPEARELLV